MMEREFVGVSRVLWLMFFLRKGEGWWCFGWGMGLWCLGYPLLDGLAWLALGGETCLRFPQLLLIKMKIHDN